MNPPLGKLNDSILFSKELCGPIANPGDPQTNETLNFKVVH